jgi:predicted Zn finger-like uncharacterized protein
MMIIECSTCQARFRLDESKIKGRGVRVRCRKCGDGIVVMKTAGPSAPPSPGAGENTLDLRTLLQQPAADPPRDERAGAEDISSPGALSPGDAPGSTAGEEEGAPTTGKESPPQEDPASPPDDPETFAERYLPGREELPEPFGATAEPSRFRQPAKSSEDSTEEGLPSGTSAEDVRPDKDEGSSPLPVPSPPLPREGAGTAEADLSRRSGEEHREDEDGTEDRGEPTVGEKEAAEADETVAPGFTVDFAPEERLDFSIEEKAGSSGEDTTWSAPSPAAPGGADAPIDLEPMIPPEAARDEDSPGRRYDISGNIRLKPDEHPETGTVLPFPDDALRNAPSRAEELQKELRYLEDLAPPVSSSLPAPPIDTAPLPKPTIRTPPAGSAARRGREARPRSRVGSLFVLFLLLAGGGAYLGLTERGRNTMDTLLSQAAYLQSGGRESASPYDIENLIGYYESTFYGGRLFVIKGQVTNSGRTSKSGIRIQASLLDGRAQEIARKTAYAGNVLAGEVLRQASHEAIEAEQSNRFGSNLINMDVSPGRSVPFMVVFIDAPDGIDAYRVVAQDGD